MAERYRKPSFAVSVIGTEMLKGSEKFLHFLTIVEAVDAVTAEDAHDHAHRQFEAANPGFVAISTIHEALDHG